MRWDMPKCWHICKYRNVHRLYMDNKFIRTTCGSNCGLKKSKRGRHLAWQTIKNDRRTLQTVKQDDGRVIYPKRKWLLDTLKTESNKFISQPFDAKCHELETKTDKCGCNYEESKCKNPPACRPPRPKEIPCHTIKQVNSRKAQIDNIR